MRVRTGLLFLGLTLLLGGCMETDPDSTVEALWPAIEPFETGHLRVSPIHEIYYELSGNPEGIPVLVLHGGPGGRSSPYMRRFYDPERYLIVLHDQRGAGKSRPYGELRENDTWELVEDIERLRLHLGLDRAILFGGSWGTTLALAYAETHPERVAGLVLRGVFTATRAEIDHFYHGGAAVFFPDVYERFLAKLPDPARRPLPAYLYELIQTSEPPERERYCMAWAKYEVRMAALTISDEEVDRIFEEEEPCTFALFENYYMTHRCFLEEGQLLENAGLLAGIPTYIVNGRYDAVCPPRAAYELQKRIPGSKLIIAEGSGHWMGEPEIERTLLAIFHEFDPEL
jgi:proline iminopeptidase